MTFHLGFCLFAGPAILLASPSSVFRPYLIEHYEAALRLDPIAGRLTGTAHLRVRALINKLSIVELDTDELAVTEIRTGRQLLHFTQRLNSPSGGTLAVTLPQSLGLRKSRILTLHYTGLPKRGLRFFSDQAWTAFSTSNWLPSNSQPDNRATFRLQLDIPADWKVVANGRCVREHVRGNRLLSTWDQPVPIPSFVFGFAVGQFKFAEEYDNNVRLRMFSARHTPDELRRLGVLIKPMLNFFAGRAGVPYPGVSYTQVFTHGNPMQEVGGFTLFPEQYADELLAHPDDQWLMAHELAHQWWGIGVTCSTWSDFWLNEGVATFLADVYLGERFGPARYLERSRQVWEELKLKGQDRPLHFTNWATPQEAGGRLPYHKGAWMLHLLREEIGANAFWRGLQTFTQGHWQDSVTSAEFQQAMEGVSGQNLDLFFRTWVY